MDDLSAECGRASAVAASLGAAQPADHRIDGRRAMRRS
jgi:hypothetical protein